MPTAIDLFAGLDGWSTGARDAGIGRGSLKSFQKQELSLVPARPNLV